MPRKVSFLLSACLIALVFAAPAGAVQTSTVTATGTGQGRVLPKNRNSNASIKAAYEAAHTASVAAAMSEAREYAVEYAQAAGLTLGPVVSVTDAQNNSFYGSGGFVGPGGFYGSFGGAPFGPNQFCGTVRQPIFKSVNGHRKVVRFKKVHRCFVPGFATTTLTVTYSAT